MSLFPSHDHQVTEEFKLVYKMEGYDFLPSGYGNSYAKNLTLSFWVRSNLTGTYRINFMSRSGTNRNIGATYTISSANTWEKKEITFIPDTSVSPYQDHQDAFRIEWYLASGPDRTTGSVPTSWATMDNATRATGLNVNMASSTDNEWYITGVQLELGDNASDFEHRSFGEELALCQRYYFKFLEGNTKEIGVAWYYTAAHASFMLRYPTTMRATPTGIDTTGTGYYTIYRNGGSDAINSITFENGSTEQYSAYNNSEASGTAGQAGIIRSTNASAKVEFDAEL